MVGDFATKPLQGALFRKFRDQILGVVEMPKDVDPMKVDAEPKRVGKKVGKKADAEPKTVGKESNLNVQGKTRVASSKGERRVRFDLKAR